MDVDIDIEFCDVGGGRDCSAFRMVWRGIESIEYAFLRCLRLRCSRKDVLCGRVVRFSIDDAVEIEGWWSVRQLSSEGVDACCNAAGRGALPLSSVVATGCASSGVSLWAVEFTCGGCGASGAAVWLIVEGPELRPEKAWRWGDRAGWIWVGENGSPWLGMVSMVAALLILARRQTTGSGECQRPRIRGTGQCGGTGDLIMSYAALSQWVVEGLLCTRKRHDVTRRRGELLYRLGGRQLGERE